MLRFLLMTLRNDTSSFRINIRAVRLIAFFYFFHLRGMKSQKCTPQLSIPSIISPIIPTSSSTKEPRNQEPEFQLHLTRGQLIETIARLLLAMIGKNQNSDPISPPPGVKSAFYMKSPPQISLYEYIKRISDYANCSDVCFLLALIYIDRFLKQDETFELNTLNVFK